MTLHQRRDPGGFRDGKQDADPRTLARCAVDPDFRAVAPNETVHHGEPQARAPLTLGREEGLQTATTRLLVHPNPAIAHFQPCATIDRLRC